MLLTFRALLSIMPRNIYITINSEFDNCKREVSKKSSLCLDMNYACNQSIRFVMAK